MPRELGRSSVEDRDSPVVAAPGTILADRYELLEHLGSGGMGTVYRARDLEAGQVIALKLLALTEATSLRRFHREFRAASRLAHPNVVRVLSYHGQDPPFFTMELVRGPSLAHWVREAGGAGERVERIRSALNQILAALQCIHAQGLVHRDLKPDNILVSPEGQVKITDFGVVRGGASSGGLTVGRVVGTLGFMAPEQLEGRPVDARSDLYSVGAILYELLTGEPPFDGNQLGTLARAILHEAPVPPRERRRDADPVLAGFAMTLLAKKPWERFGSAGEALAVLEARSGHVDEGPRPPRLVPARFVGRDEELGLAREMLRGRRGAFQSFLLVRGECGTGKSRFLVEVLALARSLGLATSAVEASGGDGRRWAALRELLERLAEADLGPRVEAAIRALDGALEEATESGGAAANRAARALGQAIRLACRGGPLVLVLDDLEHLDAPILDLLATLVLDAGGEEVTGPGWPRILLVASDTDRGSRPLRGALGRLLQRGCSVTLEPFRREETAAYARTMLGELSVPAALVEWLQAETGGNPYLLEETLRELVAEGFLVEDRGTVTLDRARLGKPPRGGPVQPVQEDFGAIPAGRSLRELLRSQVARLSAAARQVLTLAAASGTEPRFEVLLGASGLAEDGALDALQELLEARLLAEAPGRLDRYRFVHARVRELLLEALPAESSRALHLAVARAIEAGEPPIDVVALADHYQQAGLPRQALDLLPAAARELGRRGALAEAAEALGRLLSLAEQEPHGPELRSVRHGLARELHRSGRLGDARLRLEGLLEEDLEPGQRAEILAELAQIARGLGDHQAMLDRTRERVDLLRVHGGPLEQASALMGLGQACLERGLREEAGRSFRDAGAMYRELGHELGVARSTCGQAVLARLGGELAGAAERLQGALALFRRCGSRPGEWQALASLGRVHLEKGELDLAIDCQEAAMRVAREQGAPDKVAGSLDRLGEALLAAGDLREASACLEACLRWALPQGARPLIAAARLHRAALQRESGGAESGIPDLRAAREAMQRGAEVSLLIELELEVVRLELGLGHATAARRAAREALALARAHGLTWYEAAARADLAELLRGPGALAQALRGRQLAQEMGAELLLARVLDREARIRLSFEGPGAAQGPLAEARERLSRIAGRLGSRQELFLRGALARQILAA